MRKWRKAIAAMFAAAAVGMLGGCSQNTGGENQGSTAGSDEVYTLRISNIQTQTSPIGQALDHMIELAEEKSGGRLQFEHYPGGTLGADRVNIENAQAGTVEIGNSSTSNLTTFIGEFNALELPYVTTPENDEQFYESLDNGELGQYFEEKFHAIGLQPLAYYSQGYRIFLTVPETPLTCAADFKNVKLRSTSSEVEIALDDALGATPTPIPANETYTAMQQRTVEGNNGAIAFAYDNKYYEVCKNVLVSNHNFLMNVVVINKDIYDSLPEDLRQILDESFAESEKFERELMAKENENAIQAFKDNGCTVTELTGENYEEFVGIATSIWDQFLSDTSVKEAFDMIRKTQEN